MNHIVEQLRKKAQISRNVSEYSLADNLEDAANHLEKYIKSMNAIIAECDAKIENDPFSKLINALLKNKISSEG
jgi:hypothetical protein